MTNLLAPLRLALFAGLTAIPAPLWAQSLFGNWGKVTDPIAIASKSTEEYAKQKFGAGAPKPESYLFFQGKFYGGATRDPNLEKAQFDEIVKVLGENMARQNYFPSKDVKSADLLIVVHWGVTTLAFEPSIEADKNALNHVAAVYANHPDAKTLMQLEIQQSIVDAEQDRIDQQSRVNAELLGFKDQFYKDAAHSASAAAINDAENMVNSLTQERYFVILMAYDYSTMKQIPGPKLLWSTRFSIQADGNSFTHALPVMSKIAADYFGHAIDGLKTELPELAPKGKVELGRSTVVGDGK